MTLFWIFTAALALGVASILCLAVLRGRRETGPSEAFDMQVYRDQLAEVDRDLARGAIVPEEAERLRTEVSRRILAADAKMRQESAQGAAGTSADRGRDAKGLSVAILAVVLGGALATYWQLGAPGYGDLPLEARKQMAAEIRASRPSQTEIETAMPARPPVDVPEEYLELVRELRGAVAERPDEVEGLQLLARTEAGLENFAAAWRAQEALVRVRGEAASAADYADLGAMMVAAAGGLVSPEAQTAMEQALARDPRNQAARYYIGLMLAQTGRPDAAFRMWNQLLGEGPADGYWIGQIRPQIRELAQLAGVPNYELPEAAVVAAPRGPSAADLEAADAMSPEARAEMIGGMVAQLSDRLATEGGPPEDWARLVTSLAVLGDTEQAALIYREARMLFADLPDAVAVMDEAAAAAGIAGAPPGAGE